MTDDVKDLVEPAQEWDARAVQRNPEKAARYIQALADALEAATVTPAVDREALGDIIRPHIADEYLQGQVYPSDEVVLDEIFGSGILRERTAPAVDREALARELYAADFWGDENARRDWDELIAHPVHFERYRARADALIASGILRDARDVQAEALERAREEIRSLACWADPVTGRSGFNLGNDEDGEAGARMAVLDILAQAIREARSE